MHKQLCQSDCSIGVVYCFKGYEYHLVALISNNVNYVYCHYSNSYCGPSVAKYSVSDIHACSFLATAPLCMVMGHQEVLKNQIPELGLCFDLP